MIISLEGSRGSGKTYLLKRIKEALPKGVVYSPTDDEMRWIKENSPGFAGSYAEARQAEEWFFSVISQRFHGCLDGKINFFERDYLSSLSFSYAYSHFSGISTYPELFRKCQGLLEEGIFRKPDLRIVLDNNYQLFLGRAKGRDPKRQDIWFNEGFAEKLFEYYRTFTSDIEPGNTHLIPAGSDPSLAIGLIKKVL